MDSYQHRWHKGEVISLDNAKLGCSKVVCVGKNYAAHIKEMGDAAPTQAVLFLKPPSALCNANQTIKVSHLEHLGELHHELEIALLIGRDLTAQDADVLSAISGIGLGIDLTLRKVQSHLKKQGLPWERAKAFDGSCALSGFIELASSAIQLDNISLELKLNNQTQQRGNSALMLNSIGRLLAEIVSVFSLTAGDVVLTGTPAGVGPLKAGDCVRGLLNDQVLISDTLIS
jgi:2-keto-4-pentenoate hydratase/2-oxohepta-3-ene-1,7-dioic acid hydratase in catechol pathway